MYGRLPAVELVRDTLICGMHTGFGLGCFRVCVPSLYRRKIQKNKLNQFSVALISVGRHFREISPGLKDSWCPDLSTNLGMCGRRQGSTPRNMNTARLIFCQNLQFSHKNSPFRLTTQVLICTGLSRRTKAWHQPIMSATVLSGFRIYGKILQRRKVADVENSV